MTDEAWQIRALREEAFRSLTAAERIGLEYGKVCKSLALYNEISARREDVRDPLFTRMEASVCPADASSESSLTGAKAATLALSVGLTFYDEK